MLFKHHAWIRALAEASVYGSRVGHQKSRPLSLELIISAHDQVLARYGNQLAALGEGQARTALSRALNHEGDKGRTQVKRTLAA